MRQAKIRHVCIPEVQHSQLREPGEAIQASVGDSSAAKDERLQLGESREVFEVSIRYLSIPEI